MVNDAPSSMIPAGDRHGRGVVGIPVGLRGPDSGIAETPRAGVDVGYWLRDGEVLLRLRSGLTCPIALLSPAIAWIEPDSRVEHAFGERIEISLVRHDAEIGPFPAVIMVQAMMGRRGPFLALSFEASGPARGPEVAHLLKDLEVSGAARPAHAAELWDVQSTRWARAHEVIDRPDRVLSVLAEMAGRKGLLQRTSGGAPVCVSLIEVEGEEMRWSTDERWGREPVRIDIFGYNSVYRIRVDALEERDGVVVSRLPARVERIRQRLLRHGVIRSALTVSYAHPLWPDRQTKDRELLEVTFREIAFAVAADESLIYPGLTLPSIEVSDGQGITVHLTALVRSVAQGAAEGKGPRCTLAVTPCTPEDERRWIRLVTGTLYLTTRSAPDWTRALWDLFESSGYFSLSGKSAGQFAQLKQSFMSLGKRAAALPHLFCQAVWVSRRGVEATVSVLKAYEGTWLGHQLAKRGGPPHGADPRTILRDIYFRGLEHPLTDTKFEWMLGYVEASVAWMNRSHVAFALQHEASGESMVLPFQLMEVRCSQPPLAAQGGDHEVGPPSDAELALLVEEIRRTRPRAYVDALNFTPKRLFLQGIREEWHAAGLERERGFLIARRGGEPVAAAVLELGEIGTNLFRLLDGVRLFPLRPGGEAAFGALLDGSRAWYSERGRTLFVYYREYEEPRIQGDLGDLGEGKVWIISARLLPDFLEFVYELTAPKRVAGR